jgi:hypothetical protein
MYSYTLSLTSAGDGVGRQLHAHVVSSPGKGHYTRCTGDRVGSRVDVDGCGNPGL